MSTEQSVVLKRVGHVSLLEPNPVLVEHAKQRRRVAQRDRGPDHGLRRGRVLFVYIHLLWFGCWIGFRVEHYPYGLLTMIVSLEAIFLSTFVMISQNRADAKRQVVADRQSQLQGRGRRTKSYRPLASDSRLTKAVHTYAAAREKDTWQPPSRARPHVASWRRGRDAGQPEGGAMSGSENLTRASDMLADSRDVPSRRRSTPRLPGPERGPTSSGLQMRRGKRHRRRRQLSEAAKAASPRFRFLGTTCRGLGRSTLQRCVGHRREEGRHRRQEGRSPRRRRRRDALFAIDYASATVEEAEYAVLDAISARMEADELAVHWDSGTPRSETIAGSN